jgi:succinate dehydrogenase/fumarate reductase flavoprotein subunit
MELHQISGQNVTVHFYNTVIVGAGAAGMNCAVHLYEFMQQIGVDDAEKRIAVVTAGLPLGASRMSGSDKQTYYKMGTSPDVPDSAEDFAKSLTAAGCCHEDLALVEAIGSLREFYHLARAGVQFLVDAFGSYIGYKTDHDPYQRATSAGPKTSRDMSECLEKQVRHYGIPIHDKNEAAHLLTTGQGSQKRIAGIVTIDKARLSNDPFALSVFYCENIVLAAGGPGGLFETSVYPKGQTGMHGIALEAGLAAENLTESQFGLASTTFRWNVSGTYMQAVPRVFSTDADGNDERNFLADFFPSMSKMATAIFLKGYQWPFDPKRINNFQSSLIDILVFTETQKGRRVFMDFLHNPIGSANMKDFEIAGLEEEAFCYLQAAGALQHRPIDRLAHMNPLAIDIYRENGIDLFTDPLEIAVCAQHNNGGFAVNTWWQSNIEHTFVIGEMAGTHGVKRPGGSALNAGQVGGLRAAQYIAHVFGPDVPCSPSALEQLDTFIDTLSRLNNPDSGRTPGETIKEIQHRMTTCAGHIRKELVARKALDKAVALYKAIDREGFRIESPNNIIRAVKARHLALASVAYLKAVVELLSQSSGSRGSHLVLSDDGIETLPDLLDPSTGNPLRIKPENKDLRDSVLQLQYDSAAEDLFTCRTIPVRKVTGKRKAFEPAWQDYREGKIYD